MPAACHYYEVTHRSTSGELISINYLRESDNEAESREWLCEVIRYTPWFGWSTSAANRRWGKHWISQSHEGITVRPMTGLPEIVEANLP